MNKLIWAAVLLVAGGCATYGKGGGPQRMSTGTSIPAAEGTVTFGKGGNGNISIDLTVKYLAPPQKLTPPSNSYVVWVRPNKDSQPQSIGALTVDKNLNGTLKTVTALQSFELFITAESSGQVQTPTGDPLLWTNYVWNDGK